MAEARDPPAAVFHAQKSSCTQEQLQATLSPNNLAVLHGSGLSPEQLLPAPDLLTFPAPAAADGFPQRTADLCPRAPGPCSRLRPSLLPFSRETPMEEPQAAQRQTQSPQQTFQNLPLRPAASTLSPGQRQLFHTNPNLSDQDQPSSLLFSSQGADASV